VRAEAPAAGAPGSPAFVVSSSPAGGGSCAAGGSATARNPTRPRGGTATRVDERRPLALPVGEASCAALRVAPAQPAVPEGEVHPGPHEGQPDRAEHERGERDPASAGGRLRGRA